MRTLKPLAASIALALISTATTAADITLNISDTAQVKAPSIVKGDWNISSKTTSAASLKSIVATDAAFKANGNEDFTVKRQWIDKSGKQHTQMEQTINGLKVYGAGMTVHADNNAQIYAISGRLAVNGDPQSNFKAMSNNIVSNSKAIFAARQLGKMIEKPQLAYIYLPLSGETKLAWKTEVKWNNKGNDFGHDAIFIDVNSGEVLARHAKVHQAKNWKTYDINNLDPNSIGPSTSPGTLLCSNNENCGDSSAQRAHDSASSVYDFYKARFNRNSVNGSDMTVTSSVHVGNNYANAFWYNGQMFYGDGDGSRFYDLTLAHDVVGHELTHGVVEFSAGLVYQNASGALNEGFADIMGAASEAYKNGSLQPDWKIGEEVMVNGTALRYMNNPTADGYSTDWFPDRIPFTSNPNSSNDYGGVHGNSGIANLAFVLLTDGGTHPRGKSAENVPGIGLAKSEQIFYRALNTYMNSSTDFDGARAATKQAAIDLYGATEATAVESAWCAVGVGSCPNGGGTGGVDPINSSVSNISVSKRSWKRYDLNLSAGYSQLKVTTTGGSGDADLYLRLNTNSTRSQFDCRSWASGNTESCTINNPGAGTWNIDLYGYSAASGINLSVTAN